MTNTPTLFFEVDDIIDELKIFIKKDISFDVVTIVGEGEPTLYAGLKSLIMKIKALVDQPVAVITNGGLLYLTEVQQALTAADIVLPTFDAYDNASFKKINRPIGHLDFDMVYQGLINFSRKYHGELWLEMMFVKGLNDGDKDIKEFQKKLQAIVYKRLYLNTPVRPPAEVFVESITKTRMREIAKQLNGVNIDLLVSDGFYSEISNHIEAIKSIIKRHPMNQFEIRSFLNKRDCNNIHDTFDKLSSDDDVEIIQYKKYQTYRLK